MKTFSVEQSRLFHLGQTVNAPSFIDCFGKTVEPKDGLTIVGITAMADKDLSYYRVDARRGFIQVEGAERFFEVAQ